MAMLRPNQMLLRINLSSLRQLHTQTILGDNLGPQHAENIQLITARECSALEKTLPAWPLCPHHDTPVLTTHILETTFLSSVAFFFHHEWHCPHCRARLRDRPTPHMLSAHDFLRAITPHPSHEDTPCAFDP